MRALADSARIERLMEEWGRSAAVAGDIYLTGGATAVLNGWRDSTVDVDVKASPADFIPVLQGWEERSPPIRQVGQLTFRHFDLTAQALSKAERGHAQDRQDVADLLASGLVTAAGAREQFEQVEPLLYRFPAIDPPSFRAAVEELFPLEG